MENYEELAAQAIKQLFHGGAFLMTGRKEKNPMTVGWCQFGRVWNRKVLTIYVRHSRHSFALLERDEVFTLSFPVDGAMKKELGFCGVNSGRDMDKLEKLQLSTHESTTGGVDGLVGCGLHFECRVLYKLDMCGHMDELYEAARNEYYKPGEGVDSEGDPHMVYFAEVLDAYQK